MTVDDTNNNIQEGEIVEATASSENSEALILLNIEGLIKSNISKLDKLSDELKKQNEMIQSVLDNDPIYKEHSEKAKEAARVKGNTKKEILKRPEVSHVVQKANELKSEIKEIKESQSSYLSEYQRLSGSTEIETEDGQVRQIIYVAKLVKRA